jgi:hypothetical protein
MQINGDVDAGFGAAATKHNLGTIIRLLKTVENVVVDALGGLLVF